MLIKVKKSVDLLIVGASVSGCETAIKEHNAGKSVRLTTSYSFFGEDICSLANSSVTQ